VQRYEPDFVRDVYLCLRENNHSSYYLPKKNRFGYFANEMPFYYEKTATFLVPQHMEIDDYHEYQKISFPALDTPASDENDNLRTNSILVNYNIDAADIAFDAKVDLKGQFSTMCRGAYTYDFVDTFSNTKYGQMISRVNDKAKLIKKEATQIDETFPFKSTFRVKYSLPNNIQKTKDSVCFISMDKWFNHVTYDNFSAKNRHTDFYTDFKGVDVYRYYIKLDHNVQVLNTAELEKDITNTLGNYKIKITQPQPNTVQIESYYLVNVEKVEAKKVADVENIYTAINNLNKAKLKVKLLN
jgi:hypothetical protein